jgi:hypothetical protein
MLSTNEPNDPRENCVIMWSKEGYNWGDWGCQAVRDAQYSFKPICQMDRFDVDDYGGGGGGKDTTGKPEERVPNENFKRICVEADVKYKGQMEVDRIKGVYSHEECRRQCALNSRCDTWKSITKSKSSLETSV